MTVDNSFTMKKFQSMEIIYVTFSQITKLPYVECDPETFDDEVMIYFDEQSAKAKTEELAQKKIPTTVLKLASKQMLLFFTTLYTMGVNALHLSFNGEETTMQIQEIVKKRDQKEAPDGSVWVENPQLHLTAVYFAQELRRPAGGYEGAPQRASGGDARRLPQEQSDLCNSEGYKCNSDD